MRFLMLMIPAVYQPGAPDPEAVVRTMDPEKVARMMKLNEDLHAADEGDIVEIRQIQEMEDFSAEVTQAVKDNAPNVLAEMHPRTS